jgi:hypothetical protein
MNAAHSATGLQQCVGSSPALRGRKLLPARRTLFQIDVLGLISDMGDFATIDVLDSAMTTLTILKSRVNGLEPA